MEGIISRVNQKNGHFIVYTGTTYFGHFSEIRNVAHQCLIEDGQRVTFTLGRSPTGKRREEARDVFVVDAPSIPSELQVEAILDHWDSRGFGFAKLVSCGCRVFVSRLDILTDPAYLFHLVIGARLVLNVHRERDHRNKGSFTLTGKCIEILVSEEQEAAT
jgi:cold shock CspA family protein